ncbi:unnamed protein product [Vitrella brassicaformis CCMP3155]|uniref:Uncharacterized protein n=1 Tax=Vitrella brassicaformis (strain CCMP3155) TaxID=1169540 RepID=A0A0G4GJ37_VITBC|nr:unnamed protein product [Vitrella brassicaformis CCMP3155]|eukprot:CEM29835.1 unnamed protein product [Vitrella brassicaformis CCMP3155]
MDQPPGCFAGMFNLWRWLKASLTVSQAKKESTTCNHDGAGISKTTHAANGVSTATPVNQQQQHDSAVSASDVPEEAVPTVAEYVRSYSQLEALIDAHPTQFTTAVLLPILKQLLSAVVEGIFGASVEATVPQLALDRAIMVAITRWLFMLERGGDWGRWRPHLELLYHLRGKSPLVLGDEHFSAFGSRAAFIGEREAVCQWRVLSREVNVRRGSQQMRLMDGCRLPFLLDAPSPLFPRDTFDAADPPTQLDGWTYPSYASLVAFSLFSWLRDGSYITFSRDCSSYCRASAASLRVRELLAAPQSDAAQWGSGAAVFDRKWQVWARPWHERLVVLGSEVMGQGNMAAIRVEDWGDLRSVRVFTTESAPDDRTRTTVMRVLGRQLGGKAWRMEDECGCLAM